MKAIIATSSKKKDVTAVVSKGLNIVKSPCKSDNEKIKAQGLVGLCRLAEACSVNTAKVTEGKEERSGLREAAGG